MTKNRKNIGIQYQSEANHILVLRRVSLCFFIRKWRASVGYVLCKCEIYLRMLYVRKASISHLVGYPPKFFSFSLSLIFATRRELIQCIAVHSITPFGIKCSDKKRWKSWKIMLPVVEESRSCELCANRVNLWRVRVNIWPWYLKSRRKKKKS